MTFHVAGKSGKSLFPRLAVKVALALHPMPLEATSAFEVMLDDCAV
jgi:hypothetical protein